MLFNFFLLLCFYLPFQVALNPAIGVDLASIRIFILLVFFLWLAEGCRKKKIALPGNLTGLFVAGFLFLNSISIIVARNQEWSLRKILFLLSVSPIFFVSHGLIGSREKVMKALNVLLVSGSIVAILGIVQFILQFILGLAATYRLWAVITMPFLGENLAKMVTIYPSWLVNVAGTTILRATSLFPDPHMFSFYLGLLLPVSLGMFVKNKRPIYLAAFILLLTADILTFSRGGYAGLIAGGLALFIFSWIKLRKKLKVASLAFLMIFLVLILLPGPISTRFFSSFNPREGSNVGRMEMWEKAWRVAAEHPMLGVGIGNYPLEVKASADYREPIYAHNTYLDIASETGVLSMFSWIALIITSIWSFIKLGKQDNIFIYLAASIVIFSIHSLVDTAIYSPVVLSLFLIIISFSAINLRANEKNI